jgi:acyl carrier protein
MPSQDELLKTITDTIREVLVAKGLEPPELTPRTSVDRSLGLDSLDWAAVAVQLEERIGVDPFADGVDRELSTIEDLVAVYEQAAG